MSTVGGLLSAGRLPVGRLLPISKWAEIRCQHSERSSTDARLSSRDPVRPLVRGDFVFVLQCEGDVIEAV